MSGRYLPSQGGLSSMQEVRLTVKKRAFPSQGRVRLNIAHLPALGIREGEHVDLINEATKKSVTTTVMADTMVRQGHVRISEEDLKTIGLQDDDDVLVRKTLPKQEKIKKQAADAGVLIENGTVKPGKMVKKASGGIKDKIVTSAESSKKETKKVVVKKTMKKVP